MQNIDPVLFLQPILALEVEQERRYKSSHEAICNRLKMLNSRSTFFDEIAVVFVPEDADLDELVELESRNLASKD